MTASAMEKMINTIQKAKLLGKLTEVSTVCSHICYLISYTNNNHLLYIPDNVTQPTNEYAQPGNNDRVPYTVALSKLTGTLKVVGGNQIANADGMFNNCCLDKLDLSDFEPKQLNTTYGMFCGSYIANINLSKLNTSEVTDMTSMFEAFKTDKLDLSSLDTSKVISMSSMFSDATIKSLNISGFNTQNVRNMESMFADFRTKKLDLSNFDTSNVENMQYMFYKSKIDELNISKLNTSKVTNMNSMFYGCDTGTIDISNFDMSMVNNTNQMFKNCVGYIKYTDSRMHKIIMDGSDFESWK